MRTVALIDGEHYASTVRDALVELPYEFVGAVMVSESELTFAVAVPVPLLAGRL